MNIRVESTPEKADCSFGWEYDVNCFLGQSWSYLNKLSIKRENYCRRILRVVIWQAKSRNCKKRLHFQKKILFPQDNEQSYTTAATIAKIHELRFELFNHPTYLPNLVPSDLFLFPKLKVVFGKLIFSSNEEVIIFVKNIFSEKNFEYYLTGWRDENIVGRSVQKEYIEKLK